MFTGMGGTGACAPRERIAPLTVRRRFESDSGFPIAGGAIPAPPSVCERSFFLPNRPADFGRSADAAVNDTRGIGSGCAPCGSTPNSSL